MQPYSRYGCALQRLLTHLYLTNDTNGQTSRPDAQCLIERSDGWILERRCLTCVCTVFQNVCGSSEITMFDHVQRMQDALVHGIMVHAYYIRLVSQP